MKTYYVVDTGIGINICRFVGEKRGKSYIVNEVENLYGYFYIGKNKRILEGRNKKVFELKIDAFEFVVELLSERKRQYDERVREISDELFMFTCIIKNIKYTESEEK